MKCSLMIKKKSRYWFKKRNQFSLEHNIKSSVPRLTLSMNTGHWVDESVGIYELIGKEIHPKHKVDLHPVIWTIWYYESEVHK